ncbi:hypothetical protein RBWH47_05345 [Rhodopirellula baltica WH47]|uniref:Uncharacterized protein n=1 Tax=Rhodopirellula baltica WH47 TaxID=991778 RepID=F2API2_RHOBT|nr:hypothetical protein RBWH47_05345 [Rhodopirellula baltica WH47]
MSVGIGVRAKPSLPLASQNAAGFAKNLEWMGQVAAPIRRQVHIQTNQTMLGGSEAMRAYRVHPLAG